MDGWSAVVFVVCCVGSSVCDGLITCLEEFLKGVCMCVCVCLCIRAFLCVRVCVCVCVI